jgi:hypothetical protein
MFKKAASGAKRGLRKKESDGALAPHGKRTLQKELESEDDVEENVTEIHETGSSNKRIKLLDADSYSYTNLSKLVASSKTNKSGRERESLKVTYSSEGTLLWLSRSLAYQIHLI